MDSRFSSFSLGVLSTGATALAQTPQYQITDLSQFGFASATAINNAGVVVGSSATSRGLNNGSALIYSGGTVRTLTAGIATGINDAGQVVGVMYTAPDTFHGFLYDGSSFTDLATATGHLSAEPIAINNAGTILGRTNIYAGGVERMPVGPGSDTAGPPIYNYRPFTYSNGTFTDFGNFGASSANPVAINDAGTIIGNLQNTATGGFVIQNGAFSLLPTAPGFSAPVANGINASGQIVGSRSAIGTSSNHAYVYQNGTYTDLPPTAGNTLSVATDINDNGQILGYQAPPPIMSTYDFAPFIVSNHNMIDLNAALTTAGFDSAYATSINNVGQVIGIASFNGRSVPFLATPVPATTAVPLPAAVYPATLTLAALALAGVARRRHTRA